MVTAVVPVKSLRAAKSRLGLPPRQRAQLALAFALDTIDALSACPRVSSVVVVASDPLLEARLDHARVRIVPDPGDGLGAAVRDGLTEAARRAGDILAVVPADLPCLRPDDVTAVLASAPETGGAFVPDRRSTGTTIVVYPPGMTPATHYGLESAARHSRLGLHLVENAPVRARHDVDTLDDLHAALDLGVGAATAAAVDLHGLGIPVG